MPLNIDSSDVISAEVDDIVKNSDAANFTADVIEASAKVPVIVYCRSVQDGLCRQIGSIVEGLVRQAGGRVRLVEIDVDKDRALAMQLRVQAIPTALAFHDGRPVDAFSGAQTESQLKAFVDRLAAKAGVEGGASMEQAAVLLDAGDIDQARRLYDKVISKDPSNGAAVGGRIRCELAAGDIACADAIISGLDDKIKFLPPVEAAIKAFELSVAANNLSDPKELAKKVADNENDHAARLDLAIAHYAQGDASAAIDQLIELIRRDRKWNDEAARKQLVKIFTARGFDDPLTVAGRKRLSVILFS